MASLTTLARPYAKAAFELAQAEQAVNRARINGIDDSGLYYAEASIHVIKGEYEDAIASLQTAYNKGWRQAWLLRIDGRLDPLRSMPEFVELEQRINDDVNRALAEVRSQQVAFR